MLKDDMRPDLRLRRAQMFTAEILRIVSPYVCDHGKENHDNLRFVHEKVMELFYQRGVEIVTDLDRTNVGLPLRDDKGWTPDELCIMEQLRLNRVRIPLDMTQATAQRRVNDKPVLWTDKEGITHAAEGNWLTPRDFCLWTVCGSADVPAGTGYHPAEGDKVTCQACLVKLEG